MIDSDGNRGAIIDMDLTLSPSEVEEFTAVYEIFSSGLEKLSFRTTEAEGFEAIPLDLVTEYNISTETFPTEDPVFYDLASSLVDEEDTVLEAVSTLVEYVMGETTYQNFETPQYPDDTLNNRLGDCDDQSILLITMLRSLGIPAYLQVGIFIHGSIDDTDSSWDDHLINNADGVAWHGWAMIYIPPWGWVPVDLTLTNAESGLELIKNSPEYESNIIPVLNVSKQDYIGGTVEARERFINSSVYVTVTDKAETIYGQDKPFQNYLLLGLGSALLITIGFMFRYGNPE